MMAVDYNHLASIRLLLERRADPDIAESCDVSVFGCNAVLLLLVVNLLLQFRTALTMAVIKSNIPVVALLLEEKANPDGGNANVSELRRFDYHLYTTNILSAFLHVISFLLRPS